MPAYFGQPRFVPDLYEGLFGGEWDKEKLYEIGREMFRIERKFNKEAGFGPEDDSSLNFASKKLTLLMTISLT